MPYSPNVNTTIMFLVRHAATLNNVARPPKIQGQGEDVGLSQEGLRQAGETAQFLREQPIDLAFSSPLARAMETATVIAEPHGQKPEAVGPLIEVNVGRWEGRSWVDIEREEPDAYGRFINDPATFGYAGGENLMQVQQRVLPAVHQLLAAHVGQLILVVGHNVVNRVLLATLLDVPLAKARGIDQDNCGINVIRMRNEQIKVLSTNVAFHLH
jgi:broad specificity phosphatase PhoE